MSEKYFNFEQPRRLTSRRFFNLQMLVGSFLSLSQFLTLSTSRVETYSSIDVPLESNWTIFLGRSENLITAEQFNKTKYFRDSNVQMLLGRFLSLQFVRSNKIRLVSDQIDVDNSSAAV